MIPIDRSQVPQGGAGSNAESNKFTGYQKFVVAMLAFLQFTMILDFMILSPLGALLMPALSISPSEFGVVVSIYPRCRKTLPFMAGI